MEAQDVLAAVEAYELHDFLTQQGIPDRVYSSERGTMLSVDGKHFYYLSLHDRVMLYVELFAKPKPNVSMESEVKWVPLFTGE